jgi:AraC-like DNA-binding protein
MKLGTVALYRQRLLCLAEARPPDDLLYAPALARRGQGRQLGRSLYAHFAVGIELALGVEGEARVVTPRGIHLLRPGQLLLVERGVHHAQLPGPSGEGHLVTWYHFDRTRALVADTEYLPPDRLRLVGGIELQGRTDVESVASAIASELAARESDYAVAVAALLSYMKCLLARRLDRGTVVPRHVSESPAVAGTPRTWSVIQSALEYCEANFRRRLTQAEVASAVGYSPAYLSRLISSHLGHSLADHVKDLRLAEARQLLETTDQPIRTVARAVGYDDPSHFVRAFTGWTGHSPGTYRRQHGRA